jgi:hypothetical protein
MGVLMRRMGSDEVVTLLPSAAECENTYRHTVVSFIPSIDPAQNFASGIKLPGRSALGLFCWAGRESKDGGQESASTLIPQQYHALSEVTQNSSDRGRARLHQGMALSLPSSGQSVDRIGNSPEMKKGRTRPTACRYRGLKVEAAGGWGPASASMIWSPAGLMQIFASLFADLYVAITPLAFELR